MTQTPCRPNFAPGALIWLRCQRAYRALGLKGDRPTITKSNFVCAEPMPGEDEMLKEFVAELQPKVLGHLVESFPFFE